jgi:PIN domain nuclease of toxin-antitoxin system
MTHYLLDACALLAYINGEPNAQKVLGLIEQAREGTVRLSMSIVQLLEVYYDRVHVSEADAARIRIESIPY